MIKPLTSLRFFFAFMVFVSHLWFIKDDGVVATQLYDHVFSEGYIGVSFFFILSGFILSYNYKDKILEHHISKKSFWLARFARIYPLHFVTLLVAIPLSFRHDMLEWTERFVLNLFLLQSFVPSQDVYFYFNSVSWSISDEMFFYLIFPLLIVAYYRPKVFNYWLPLLLILTIPIGLYFMKSAYHHKYFYINPVLRLADFTIGVVLYHVYELRKKIDFKTTAAATRAEILAVLLLLAFFLFHENVPQGFRYSCYYWIPMIGIVYVFSFSKGAISAILSNDKLVYLGEISFGFYMWHMLVIRYFNYIGAKIPMLTLHTSTHILSVIAVFCIALTVSNFSYRWLEIPANKYLKKRFAPRVQPIEPAGS